MLFLLLVGVDFEATVVAGAGADGGGFGETNAGGRSSSLSVNTSAKLTLIIVQLKHYVEKSRPKNVNVTS